jgi:hypothetical protein
MASIYKGKGPLRGKAWNRTPRRKPISGHGTFGHDHAEFNAQCIDRLVDENRRLENLAKCLRADIARLIGWRETRH